MTAEASRREAASRKEAAMWLLERLVPDSGVNNIAVAFEVDGLLDRELLERALRAVVDRYRTLRTTFHTDGTTLTREVLPAGSAVVPVRELPAGGERDADLTAFAAAPFRIDGRPLLRAGVRSGTAGDVACVVVHHLIFDAVSVTVLLRELLDAYEALAAGRAPRDTPVPSLVERAPDERSIAYWQKHLDGLRPTESGLWCTRPPLAAPTLRAETVHHALSEPARAVVRRLQKELRASEAIILLAAYAVLLAQHGAGSDVVIGTPVNIRGQDTGAIGYHANLVPLRVRTDPGAGFPAVVREARSTFLEAISHADVPLEHVSPAVLADAPASWRSWFFRHLFNYMPGTVESGAVLAGMPVRPVLVENGYSRFDLEFFIMPGPDATTVRAAFCVDAFHAGDVVRLLERYDALLLEIGATVDRPVAALPRLGAGDRFRPTVQEAPAPDVLAAVYATVAADPERVAIADDGRSVTYRRLWSAALATRDLVADRAARVVAVFAPRGAELAAAWLGTWLAGARCVLLDPAQPVPGLAARLTDSGADLVLATEGIAVPGAVRVPDAGDGIHAAAPATFDPGTAAYLEYHLDTREPLAVTVSHRALAAAVARTAGRTATGPGAATDWRSSTATAAGLIEPLLALTTGGRAVVGAGAPHHGPVIPGVAGPLPDDHAFISEPGTPYELGTGVRGELCVTGPALATGYHRRPELDAERFGTHPEYGRFHRTGQLARRLPDGRLDLAGELGAQVTVAGQRVCLADIEAVLGAHPDVRTVAVVESPGGAAGHPVVAFAEAGGPEPVDPRRLAEHARTVLPFGADVVVLNHLPRTVAGTVDRAALVALAASRAQAAAAAPPDETAVALTTLWIDLLGRPDLHADSNFFANGGHSLLGAQLVQRAKAELDLPVGLADLFANPTPRQLSEHLQTALWDDDD
ncbi:condensation domain-containing protein [Actinoplanes sp. NPDC049802]|uniref:condensation domain-containing protein n=1 Tax=Actinoplanes sp. NPDC049802 TaxID=3154742 RepID=UPI0033CD87D5